MQNIVIPAIIEALGGEDGLTLEELLNSADKIKTLLKSVGVDTEFIENYGIDTDTLKTALKGVYAALEEYSEYGDVYVKFVNDETKVVPDSHGVYVVGAVTADTNYNTAANATIVVVTAEPVTVKFDDVNDNNARQFTYDGTPKAMTAKAYDEAGNVLTGTMKYVYAGMQSDGTPYLSTEAPLHAGAYTVTALFNDAGYYRAGFAVGALAIWPSDVAEVGVSNKVVVYDENNEVPVSISDMITVLPEDTDAKVAVITAGIDVATDFSEEGLSALEGTVNIDFPERADTILKQIVPSAYTEEGITLGTLKNKLAEIQTGLADLGIDASAMDQVIAALNELPDAAKLTFHNTYNGTVDTNALPRKIGAYLVTAVIFDPDYVPEAGAGVLLITPDVTEATLSWTYDDMNGVITQPVLDTVSLSATAAINGTEDAAATAMVKYIFVGLSKDGEVYTFTADQSNIAEVSKGLRNGAYTQIAYIWNGIDAAMTVAQPIVREFAHVPQQMHIDFTPDENVDNVRTFTYTGKAIEMPVEVKKLDSSAVKDECLEIRYTGVDSQGNEYDSTTAPTNVGTYVVTVTYKEYDVVPSTSLKYAGINVGVMVIEPAEVKVEVEIDDIVCSCGCDTKSCTAAKPCCDDCKQVDLDKDIKVEGKDDNLYQITVITDKEGNVNILAPWYNDGEAVTVTNIDKSIDEILAEITGIESAYSQNKASEYIDELIKELEAVNTSALDNALADAKAAIKAELESITTASVKNELKKIYKYIDDLDLSSPESIAKAADALKALADEVESTDAQLAAILDKVAAEVESIDEQTAATAAKTAKAALGLAAQAIKDADLTDLKAEAKAIRDKLISELDAIDTTAPGAAINEELTKVIESLKELKAETVKAENAVNTVVDEFKAVLESISIKSLAINGGTEFACYGEYTVTAIAFGPNHKVGFDSDTFTITPPEHKHTGGTANCQNGAICEDVNCKEEYTAKDADNHVGTEQWTKTSTTHKKYWDCCDTVTVEETEHNWKDGKCEDCEYVCEHSGETEVRGAKAATATADGYTGDTYCKVCGKLIKRGERIPATGTTPTPTPTPGSGSEGGSTGGTTGTTTTTTGRTNPNTSDISMTVFWLFATVVSAATVIALFIFKRKREEE